MVYYIICLDQVIVLLLALKLTAHCTKFVCYEQMLKI